MIAYSSKDAPHSLLEQFAIFHHLLYYSFSGENKAMASVIGSSIELVMLSSEKGAKSGDRLLESLLKYEDGFDDELVARNQLRELLTEAFPNRNGIVIPPCSTGDLASFLTGVLATK